MQIEIKDSIINEIGSLPEKVNLTLNDFLVMAIQNQMKIANMAFERNIYEASEFHEYPILPHEAGRIMKTLKDKDICAELIINPKDRKDVTVKAKIESIDFGYIKEISKNHMLTIPYPKEMDFI